MIGNESLQHGLSGCISRNVAYLVKTIIVSHDEMKKTTKTPKEIEQGEIWDKAKIKKVREFILAESEKQTPERKARNQLLALQFKAEDQTSGK